MDTSSNSIYVIEKYPAFATYKLHVSSDNGNSWKTYDSKFQDDNPLDICLTKKINYIRVIRNYEELTFVLEDYFNPGKNVQPITITLDSICIKNESVFQYQQSEPIWQDDSCSFTVIDDDTPLFLIDQCHTKFFSSFTNSMNRLLIDAPTLYKYKERKILVFRYFMLYSNNGLEWFYYPKSDFYSLEQQDRPRYNADFSWVKDAYWLEGKGLLLHLDNTILFYIDTK